MKTTCCVLEKFSEETKTYHKYLPSNQAKEMDGLEKFSSLALEKTSQQHTRVWTDCLKQTLSVQIPRFVTMS